MKTHLLVPCFATLLLCVSCATPPEPDDEGRAWTDTEIDEFFAAAKDPRMSNITTYESDDGPVFKGVNRMHPGQLALLPFDGADDAYAPVTTVTISRQGSARILFDTSSARTWIDTATAQSLRVTPLNPGDQTEARHTLDPHRGFSTVALTLRLNEVHVETPLLYVRAAVGSLGPLGRGVSGPTPRLVVGADLMSAFQYCQLDFPNRRILLSSTTPYKPATSMLIAELPTTFIRGSLAVDGAVDGTTTPLLLDTVGDFALALPDARTDRIRQLSLGDLVQRQVPVISCEEAELGHKEYPRIGLHILQRYRLTIARQGRVLYIERPAPPRR